MRLQSSRREWIKTTSKMAMTMPFLGLAKTSEISSVHTANKILVGANENPYGPSPKAIEAIISSSKLGNRYPSSLREELKSNIAMKEGISKDHILLGAGSTEILGIVSHWLLDNKKGIGLTSELTFDVLPSFTRTLGKDWIQFPMTEEYVFDLEAFSKFERSFDTVYICNPNNPTATVLPTNILQSYCKSLPKETTLIIDEAYIEYCDGGLTNSMIHLLEEIPSLIIVRTFSKMYGLAGMRVGYCIANPNLISELKKYHSGLEWSPARCSLAAAIASLDDRNFVQTSIEKNAEVKKMVVEKFDEWHITYAKSAANFIFFQIGPFERKGQKLSEVFEQHQIMTKPFPFEDPKYCRLTLGTAPEMRHILNVLSKML